MNPRTFPSETINPLDPFVAGRGLPMLRGVSLVLIIGVVVTGGYEYHTTGTLRTPVTPPTLLGFLLTLWLIHRQRVGAAIQVFMGTLLVASAIAAIYIAGIYTPILVLLPVTAMAGGLMLNRRQALLMFAFILAIISLVTWLQVHGRLPNGVALRSPVVTALGTSFICAFGLILGLETLASLRSHYGRALALGRELAQANAELEARVAIRTQELSEALERLKSMQEDLIQSEKLASLGSLVAGISHELNTPIGNAVTVATSLEARAQALQTAFEANVLKRSDLTGGLASITDMARLIDRSVERAATLIASFKQVAVDQVSERRRHFDLRAVIEENLTTLRPGLSKQPWTISNEVPPGIDCDSYPGPLGQVLTNLIQNAALHAFEGRSEGRIVISAAAADGVLDLAIEDDGVGMTTATQVRVFEPFFTTKLGRGGSGLGLAICNRIVSTILAGEIRVQSASGSGTRFVIRMPLRTPGAL